VAHEIAREILRDEEFLAPLREVVRSFKGTAPA
jgi:hypothetical protein